MLFPDYIPATKLLSMRPNNFSAVREDTENRTGKQKLILKQMEKNMASIKIPNTNYIIMYV
jgi:hypothetical protein